ncbi:MAG: hemolysin family protein [Actinomycetia bacterium]|nr:hemolysin family protein [Actinomycetes bacterium]
MTLWTEIALVVLLVVLAALFAAIESAFQRMTRGRAKQLVELDRPGAARVEQIAEDIAPTVTTALFLRLVFEVLAILMLAQVIFQSIFSLGGRLLAGGAIGVTALFIVGGVAGRTLGKQHCETIALRTALLMNLLTTVLFFVPQVMIVVGNWVTPGRGFPDGPFTSEDDLRDYLDQAEASNQIEADERRMIHSVFDLGDTIVKQVMVPRPEVVFIEATKTLRQATSLALRSGFSRIPVVGPGGLDDILGVLYLKDVMKRVHDHPSSQTSELVTSQMRPATFCPDSKPVDDLLREMQLAHSHVVVVVDEFGGTAGLATIEDILEEIVGEIVDEYDDEVPPVTDLGDGSYRVWSRLGLDDLGELFGKDLDDDDVDSVGGIMAKQLNKVPIPGASVLWEGLELVADRLHGRRNQIQTVLVRPAPEPDDATSPTSPGETA